MLPTPRWLRQRCCALAPAPVAAAAGAGEKRIKGGRKHGFGASYPGNGCFLRHERKPSQKNALLETNAALNQPTQRSIYTASVDSGAESGFNRCTIGTGGSASPQQLSGKDFVTEGKKKDVSIPLEYNGKNENSRSLPVRQSRPRHASCPPPRWLPRPLAPLPPTAPLSPAPGPSRECFRRRGRRAPPAFKIRKHAGGG